MPIKWRTVLHCICKDCGKKFMEFKDVTVKCPQCGGTNFTIHSESEKGE